LSLGLVARGLPAASLEKPDGLAVETGAGSRISWDSVEEAGLYRVAVFDAPDSEGKRLLLAAEWISGTAWTYGEPASVASAGHLPSTRPLPLPSGHKVRVMVAAARADGTDKSDWSGTDFKVPGSTSHGVPAPEPTLAPSPTEVADQDLSPSGGAELDLGGSDEFKTSPDPAVIDVQDTTKTADGAASDLTPASAAAGVSGAAATVSASAGAGAGVSGTASGDPEAAAKALLAAGKYEDAEAAFRALLDQDAKNAGAWEGLGDSYAARTMKVEAASAYEKALELNADNERLKDWMQKNVRY
jgi:hypothetical protein